jgi:hypothetical protein
MKKRKKKPTYHIVLRGGWNDGATVTTNKYPERHVPVTFGRDESDSNFQTDHYQRTQEYTEAFNRSTLKKVPHQVFQYSGSSFNFSNVKAQLLQLYREICSANNDTKSSVECGADSKGSAAINTPKKPPTKPNSLPTTKKEQSSKTSKTSRTK